MQKVIDREKSSRAMNEVKPVENISKSNWVTETFELKEKKALTQKLPDSIESSKFV